MKKQASLILLLLTLVFGSFSLGFFTGRNYSRPSVQVSALTPAAQPVAAAPAVQAALPVQTAPAETETAPSETTPAAETQASLININTADQQTLMQLPGIGEVLSRRILEYRNENGPFESVSELVNVNGIGEKRLETLLPYITVGG